MFYYIEAPAELAGMVLCLQATFTHFQSCDPFTCTPQVLIRKKQKFGRYAAIQFYDFHSLPGSGHGMLIQLTNDQKLYWPGLSNTIFN